MSGSIEGQVLNQQDGQPIEGVSLTVSGEGVEEKTSSDDNGDFQFTELAAGSYELVARKEAFEDGLYGPLVVIDGAPTKIVIALQPQQP